MKKAKRYDLPSYSLLMCVYDKELPENFNESLDSMLMQTYPPAEVVLVCDGKLTCELNIIAKSFQSEFRDIFKIVRIDKNVGAAMANNKGIEACSCEYIVKMDSDDISLPDRCARQMMLFRMHPDIDISGTFVEEFDSVTGKTIAVRKTPVRQADILKYARRRNPFNRQTVAFKKSVAVEAGGYKDMPLCEDYEFAVRLLMNGAKGCNIPEPLVRCRVTPEDIRRRKSLEHTKGFIYVRRLIRQYGFSGILDFAVPCLTQILLLLTPTFVTELVYRALRKK